MQKKRKIAMVVKRSTIDEAENDYIFFWAEKTVKERLDELLRLKKRYWTGKLGYYPDKIDKVVTKRSLNDRG